MSDLTDQFYPAAERIWLCIRLNNVGKWACDRLTEDADIAKKKNQKLVTVDELQMYGIGYDIETKAQSFQWKRPEVDR